MAARHVPGAARLNAYGIQPCLLRAGSRHLTLCLRSGSLGNIALHGPSKEGRCGHRHVAHGYRLTQPGAAAVSSGVGSQRIGKPTRASPPHAAAGEQQPAAEPPPSPSQAAEWLSTCTPFTCADVGTLAQLLAAAREVHAAPGELLVAPGVRPDGMLIIRSGTATKQYAAGHEDEEGAPPPAGAAPAGAVRNENRSQQHRKRQVGPGTVLNWRQLLMAAEARSMVVAVEPMSLWSIPADAVRAVACAQPALLVAVARGLDEEVRRMQEAAKVRRGRAGAGSPPASAYMHAWTR